MFTILGQRHFLTLGLSQKVRVGIIGARYSFCGSEFCVLRVSYRIDQKLCSSPGLGFDRCLVRETCFPGSSVLHCERQLKAGALSLKGGELLQQGGGEGQGAKARQGMSTGARLGLASLP